MEVLSEVNLYLTYLSENSQFESLLDRAADYYAKNFPHVDGVAINMMIKKGDSKKEVKEAYNRLKEKCKKDLMKFLNNIFS